MTFEEILDQAIAMLQRRGRLTYGALKRQFQLDDAYLEDLKNELIEGQRLAVDERGNVLVWAGGADVPPRPPPGVPQLAPAQVESLPYTPPPADAERRQLTVMFCDLVESTELSSQLDPEEYREVVRAYQQVCSEVITRFDGHTAQLLGDGLLVYFGYPLAHEDDAQRAVRTGLGILDAMGDLQTHLQQDKGIQLAIRIGVHTGLVVVGEMGGAGRQEQLALGETPNIAARIQGLAAPDTMAISEATSRLVQGYFVCQDLGAQTLRGLAEPVHVYRVLQESGARGRLDVAVTRGLTPLVGRESEVTLLLERWEQAKEGHGQVILLSGEAGIGKSRLVQVLKDHVAHEPHTRWECRSSEYYQNTALFPLVDLFQRLFQFHAENTPDEKFGKLEHALSQYKLPLEESVPLFVPLLSLSLPESRYALLNVSPQRQRQMTLETIVAILLELAEHQPVLFTVEDLHWTDPSTLELLNLLIDQTPTASILVLLTCRPHFQPAWHHHSYITEMTLNHLSHAQVEQIVTGVTHGRTFPAEVLQQILTKTDGVPLFVEELTKAIVESGQLKAVYGHYALMGSLSTFAIPATLQDSLMARLDRLVTAKGVAQMGATIGRQFAYDLLQAVSQLDAATLQRELGRLVEAEIVYQRGLPPQATYVFKHALIQDAAYQSLLKSTRQGYHQRIAQVLEARFPETTEAAPELLAHHYTQAGLVAQAVEYWQRAGERSHTQSASVEAVAHLRKGLEGLTTLPDTLERARRELDMQLTLGQALQVAKGYAAREVESAYARARDLCSQVEETPQLTAILEGLGMFYRSRGEFQTARDLGEHLLTLAQRQHDPERLAAAHLVLGDALFFCGAFLPARVHLDQALAVAAPSQAPVSPSSRSGVARGTAGTTAWVLWLLGYPDQALTRSQAMLTYAQELQHAFSLARALHNVATLYKLRGEADATQAWVEAALAIITEQGFGLFLGSATFTQGWAWAAQGRHEEGIVQMRQGLAMRRAMGALQTEAEHLARLGEAYGRIGHAEEGRRLLAEALAVVERDPWYEAEVHRIQGELLVQSTVFIPHAPCPMPQAAEAEASFQHALTIARRQQAKSWELRAAMSLARLWQQQGQRTAAHELLAPVYDWFTEGFDTADLQEAKALLETLA